MISGWWYTYPSEKYEFVSWDDEIPNIWKNKIHVPNHQPDILRWLDMIGDQHIAYLNFKKKDFDVKHNR